MGRNANLEELGRFLIESSVVGVMTFDETGRTTFVNARAREILRFEDREALPEASDFLDAEDRAALTHRLAQRKRGQRSTYDQRIHRGDGSIGWVEIEAMPMQAAGGAFTGVFATLIDITRRHAADDALRKSEQRYRVLFDACPLPKFVVDDETNRIVEANEAAIQTFGYSRDELSSMPFHDIVANGAVGGMTRQRTKDKRTLDVETTIAPCVVNERRCTIIVGNDITKRLRLEAENRLAQKMDTLGRLAGGVAHDFNNVLSVILTYVDMLLEQVDAGEVHDEVAEIKLAAERASTLTRQLLTFSRRRVVHPVLLDLNHVIRDTTKMLRRLVGEDVDFSVETDPTLGHIRADAGSIEQVLMNLVVNARDAMPNGGKLVVATTDVVLEGQRFAKLVVRDTGVGMSEEIKAQIFEPFFTTKEPGHGTGLGLATVFAIVQESSAQVNVETAVGEGTRFEIVFPCTRERADLKTMPVRTPRARGAETIGVVDDDANVRSAIGHLLRRWGYTVLEAENGAHALETCRTQKVDLLLSDVVMPEMSGPELAANVPPSVSVICISGYPRDKLFAHGLAEGRFVFLAKPITPTVLVEKIREVLDAKAARPRSAVS